ncbi:MAG TPA: gliding motility-associated C-terminal domain-containing protein, partial [Bacteroidetes bacterium]|nr:gliding motility-associated C-terminal domain-containing protein [Bacteroidota bacterium]
GDFLQFDITAIDPDKTNVELTAFGGPFEQTVNPAYIDPDPATGNDTVTTTFNWPTTCAHVRFEPYTAIFKARDSGFPVSLVNFKTVFINVIAPAPENLEATALGNGINLKWEKSSCQNAAGYKVYRRSGQSGWEPGYCETGVPYYTGFRLIKQLDGINDTAFRDDNEGNGLVHGVNYCYRVTAYFNDEAESRASNEACAYLKRDVPIITNVSNDSLNLQSGNVLVAWSKPIELDTVQYPGPYKYVLKRNNGLQWDNPQKVIELPGLNDTIYLDKSVNLNANNGPYVYQVDLESVTIGYIGSSQKASSIFVQTAPTDQEIKLLWAPVVPWENKFYVVYRKDQGQTVYDSIGFTPFVFYRDQGLDNDQKYCYYIKSVGHYSLPGLADPLINFSQITCAKPVDNIPPCKPVLTVETDCEEVSNTLIWSLPYDSCNQDVARYKIYFTPEKGQDMVLIKTINNPFDTSWVDSGIQNVVGCYSVTAIDSVGNVSEMSDTVCIDYDTCPPYELPNVFTPNGDNFNDFFVPLNNNNSNAFANVERVDMTIYNRWGKVMYTTHDPQINWDGKNQNNNEDCADGVYYYTCQVYIITLNGLDQMKLQGSITLYR